MKSGRVEIDEKRCKACGICIEFCPRGVLAAREPLMKAYAIAPELCIACRLCELYCPEWAVVVRENPAKGGEHAV
ncbi:MAG: 4Fe-4S dicluster domain-containing protein [Bacillota bacterium]|jgi:2-oxoglutarate ferredoxin oxidoreductase subunit delta